MPGVADLVLLLGLSLGIARGLFGPLATEGALVGAAVVVSHLHTGIDGFLPVGFRVAVSIGLVMVLAGLIRLALSPVVRALRSAPVLGPLDRPAGGAVHLLAAFLLLYVGLGMVLDFDRNVYPLMKAGVVSVHELQQYAQAVEQRPWLKGYVDQQALKQQEAIAARSPVSVGAVSKVEGFLSFYLTYVRDPLSSSRVAPVINNLGSKIPVIGHPRPYLAGAQPA